MPLAFESFFSLNCGACPVVSMAFGRRAQMHISSSKTQRLLAIAALGLVMLLWASTMGGGARQSATAAEGKDQPFAIEYYYKANWGHAEEFLALLQKHHYPVLTTEMPLGRMLKVSTTVPR